MKTEIVPEQVKVVEPKSFVITLTDDEARSIVADLGELRMHTGLTEASRNLFQFLIARNN